MSAPALWRITSSARRPGARIIVLDANASIQAEPINFGNAFKNTYKGILTYVPNAAVTSVDSHDEDSRHHGGARSKGRC